MTSEQLRTILGETFLQAIDGYFAALDAAAVAVIAGNSEAASAHYAAARAYLSTWLALLIERLDGRAAYFIADIAAREDVTARRVGNLEGLMGVEAERDHGHDETGRP